MTVEQHYSVGAAYAPPAGIAVIEFVDISKAFGDVIANEKISFSVRSGSIHGVVGENGAGKSTLMRILAGMSRQDSGDVKINGDVVKLRSPRDAARHGIGMVHQHFMQVEKFSVLENLLLAQKRGAWLPSHVADVRKKVADYGRTYKLDINPDAMVSDLSVGGKQRVEIVKALLGGARILILDEPTAVLTPQETDQLFEILRKLSREGVTTLIITHKLREIKLFTDNVTVMRRGRMVANVPTAEVTEATLAELMIGRTLRNWVVPAAPINREFKLTVENLTVRDPRGIVRVTNMTFGVRGGEIVGIAGVAGNGQSELLEALTGTLKTDGGKIMFCGKQFEGMRSAEVLRSLGVAVVPEDRLRDGVVAEFSASWNSVLGYQGDADLGTRLMLDPLKIRERCCDLMDRFEVRPKSPDRPFRAYSGGNQQKLVIAREFMRSPEVLIVGQPTRGVDIGTIELIHSKLLEERQRGAAIVLISQETDEILKLSDRIIVMCGGVITGEVLRKDATDRRLGLLMADADTESGAEIIS